jgi:hypothetical protein
LLISSCSSSHKTISVKKGHVDSSYTEQTNNRYLSFLDSTSHQSSNENYHKKTVVHLEPVEIDSGFEIVDTVPLIIKNKATGKQKIYFPQGTVYEWGNIAKWDSGHLIKNVDSIVNKRKNTKVISDTKTVDKQKTKSGFNWLWLLLLIPTPLLFKKVRIFILKLFIP